MPKGIVRKGVAHWLFKEEPEHYSFQDLQRDGTTAWDGVTNNLARKNLRQVRRGDRIFVYHTGKQKAVVGEAVAASDAERDPGSTEANAVVVRVRAVRQLPSPVSLARIKNDAQLKEWDLVRLPRLSILPVTEGQWRRVEELSREEEA